MRLAAVLVLLSSVAALVSASPASSVIERDLERLERDVRLRDASSASGAFLATESRSRTEPGAAVADAAAAADPVAVSSENMNSAGTTAGDAAAAEAAQGSSQPVSPAEAIAAEASRWVGDNSKKRPVFLIPGIMGTQLQVTSTADKCPKPNGAGQFFLPKGQATIAWLARAVKGSGFMSLDKAEPCLLEALEMTPSDSGVYADKEGLSVTFVGGTQGIEDVADPPVPLGFSAYYDSTINALVKFGAQVHGAGYDWRKAPWNNEPWMKSLATRIDESHAASGLPAVIVAHSMGNLYFAHFLREAEKAGTGLNQHILELAKARGDAAVADGKAWIVSRVGRYVAAAAPWLGSPMAPIRSVLGSKDFEKLGVSARMVRELGVGIESMRVLYPDARNTRAAFGGKDGLAASTIKILLDDGTHLSGESSGGGLFGFGRGSRKEKTPLDKLQVLADIGSADVAKQVEWGNKLLRYPANQFAANLRAMEAIGKHDPPGREAPGVIRDGSLHTHCVVGHGKDTPAAAVVVAAIRRHAVMRFSEVHTEMVDGDGTVPLDSAMHCSNFVSDPTEAPMSSADTIVKPGKSFYFTKVAEDHLGVVRTRDFIKSVLLHTIDKPLDSPRPAPVDNAAP